MRETRCLISQNSRHQPVTSREAFSQKQMMFHDVDLVKVMESKIKRPMTGVPVKKKDPVTGNLILERKPMVVREVKSALKVNKSKQRYYLMSKNLEFLLRGVGKINKQMTKRISRK